MPGIVIARMIVGNIVTAAAEIILFVVGRPVAVKVTIFRVVVLRVIAGRRIVSIVIIPVLPSVLIMPGII